MTTIAELASVYTGYHFRGSVNHKPNGQYAVIQAKDVDDSLSFDPERLARVDLGLDAERYLLRRGDVLFLSRGQRPWAMPLSDLVGATIAPSSFYVVRTDSSRIRPEYLAWYLNHESTQAMLKTMTTGSNIPFVSRAEFETLPVTVPAISLQDKIVALTKLEEREQKLLRELADRRAKLVDAVCMDLARREHTGEREIP
jgi:restriction endonuclease S subunit